MDDPASEANSVRVTITIPALPLLNPVQAQAILRQEVGMELLAVLEAHATVARQEARVGVSGLLRASIGTRLEMGHDVNTLVTGSLFTGAQAPYAEPYAYGSRPHWPPRAPIALWARRVLGNEKLAFVIQRAISRRGTPAHPRFAAAFTITMAEVQARLQRGADRAARLLGGSTR